MARSRPTSTPPIVDARLDQGPAISALAFESEASWGYDDAFMQACREELTYSATFIRENMVRVIELDNTLAAFYVLTAPVARRVELEAFFVAASHQGQGLGRRLMDDAIQHAKLEADTMLIQADPNAESFYAAMGASRIGESPSASIPGRYLPLMTISLG